MVLLSCSGTGAIYAKLANGVARYNCAQVSPPTIHRRYDLLCGRDAADGSNQLTKPFATVLQR